VSTFDTMSSTNDELKIKIPPTAKRPPSKYKKARDAPKRNRSAFILFSSEKHRQINRKQKEKGEIKKITDSAKQVGRAWKLLSREERNEWDAKAGKDKARFESEILTYKGPWKVLTNTRTINDPSAPKRPLPAFLAYANSRRAALKRDNPDATNAELSTMLSKSWKEAALPFREKFAEEAEKLRKNYQDETWEWQKRAATSKFEPTVNNVEQGGCEAIALKTTRQEQDEVDRDILHSNTTQLDGNRVNAQQPQRLAEGNTNTYLEGVTALRDASLELNRQRVANIAAVSHFQNSLIMQQLEQQLSSQPFSAPINAIAPQHPIDCIVSPHGVMNPHGLAGLSDPSHINRGNTHYHVRGLADSFVSIERTLDFLQAQQHSNDETRNDLNLNQEDVFARNRPS